ncbi:putative pectinesterase precursor [Lentinus tigrinus ALCF2SS1-7]|uniref:putative pectinesterase precursor n=1 Tax=Lentinus tigrinus ALCF2SS1-7 TaxID=1328758 RepID=UPI00116609CA|nr:putative pectinesterase precursor [Lentinus tigrinus ALCF2SS1-7]
MKFCTLGLLLTCATYAVALNAPPPGAITVGAAGHYANLSAALKDTSSLVYFVFAGTYVDTAVITRPNVRVYGQTDVPDSYSGNTVTITNNVPASAVQNNNDKSGTVQVHATNVSLYNLNIANTYGKPVEQAQAIALSVQAGSFGAYGLKITGDQDTLLANVGTQYYANSWIEGAVDFIFGQKASIWITRSVINTIGDGFITASGRSTDDAFWYVVDNSTVQGSGSAFLGRPWGDHARVVFQFCTLGANVRPAGWSVWNADDTRTSNVTFAEFANTGPGAGSPGTRANFSTQLSSPISMQTALPDTNWIDEEFL